MRKNTPATGTSRTVPEFVDEGGLPYTFLLVFNDEVPLSEVMASLERVIEGARLYRSKLKVS